MVGQPAALPLPLLALIYSVSMILKSIYIAGYSQMGLSNPDLSSVLLAFISNSHQFSTWVSWAFLTQPAQN